MSKCFLSIGIAAAAAMIVAAPVSAQLSLTDFYLDTFNLTDGRIIDTGELGGGVIGSPTTHRIFVPAQPAGVGLPIDGRLTGVTHGKFRVVNMTDRNSDGFINGTDLDIQFDVTWNLVSYDTNVGPASAAFELSAAVGPEGTPSPYGAGSANFPPTPGGTGSVWNIAACDATGFNPGTGSNFCNPLAIPAATPFTGFVDYTFPVSIPGVNDFTPGPQLGSKAWILSAIVGNTALAPGGMVTYGMNPLYSPQVAVSEANGDLAGPNLLLNGANIPVGNLLASVEIVVVPEPAALGLLSLGGIVLLRRNRRRAR